MSASHRRHDMSDWVWERLEPLLPAALETCRDIAIRPRLIPQFPIKKENSRQADRVDYFAMSDENSEDIRREP